MYRSYSVGAIARQRAYEIENVIKHKMESIRHWRLTSLGKKHLKWKFNFTIMTYNILSQTALDDHLYLYRKCSSEFLSEEYRISKILTEILLSGSDIVCLQEVEKVIYDQCIKKAFYAKGFDSVFKKRTGNKTDGCAILWKKTKFTYLSHHAIEYSKIDCKVLDRDNVGLIAIFKPCHPHGFETRLHVATTHLLYNPRRGDVKLSQLRVLLAELERLALKEVGVNGRVYHPTVLCGDFNFEPNSPLCQFIETGRLDITDLISGDMSGQHEGKNKGGKLFPEKLTLNVLGIDASGRYNICNSSTDHLEITESKMSENSEYTKRGKEPCSNLKQSSYLMLEDFMKSGQLNPEGPSSPIVVDLTSDSSDTYAKVFYHDFDFVSAYKYSCYKSNSLPVTSMVANDCSTVDHLFYNVKEKHTYSHREDSLKLLGTYSLPSADDLRELGCLPNAYLGSDHICLMSKFVIDFKK